MSLQARGWSGRHPFLGFASHATPRKVHMGLFHVVAVLIVLTALFSYVNHRYIHLHVTVGVMLIALILSLCLIVVGRFATGVTAAADQFIGRIHFDDALLHWMLCFLLFAGALSVDVNELLRHRGVTAALATAGTILSMLMMGLLASLIFRLTHIELKLIDAFLLGAILSPTDPVAVLGTMKLVRAPKDAENVIAAESLFNDGIGVVLFLTLLALWRHDGALTVGGTTLLFVRQSLGGAALGFVAGAFIYRLLRKAHNYHVDVLLTLALAMGSYAIADVVGVSGPIAVVVAGLLVGNHGRTFDLSAELTDDLMVFWQLIDEILNAMLFLLIGLQVTVMRYSAPALIAGVLMIPAALLARWASVAGVIRLFTITRGRFSGPMIGILTWGGLRGGLAVAMALSVPPGIVRDRLVLMTYIVVIFSIAVQGTTTGALVRRLSRPARYTLPDRPQVTN